MPLDSTALASWLSMVKGLARLPWLRDSVRKGKTVLKVLGLDRSKVGSRKMSGMSSFLGWGWGEGVVSLVAEGVVSLEEQEEERGEEEGCWTTPPRTARL